MEDTDVFPHMARAGELALALIIAVLAVPLVAFTAVLSLLCYRTWPFFSHERIGLHGRRFRFIKIRTLPPVTDPFVDKYSLTFVDVPRSMQLVRRLHLDELPQLLHVISGAMTFVGPRPEMPALHDQLPGDFASERTSVRPGLTCLWQISAHNAGLIGERPEYDLLYVRHHSARLDLWIVGRTVAKMFGRRPVHLHEVPHWAMKTLREPPVDRRNIPAPATGASAATARAGPSA